MCPAAEKWLLLSLGELSVNEAGALAQHRALCASCRAKLSDCRALLEDLNSPPELELTDDAFSARVLAACSHAPPAQPARRGLRKHALLGGALAAAAALLLALPWPREERWTARGHSASQLQASPSAELFFVRGGAVRPLSSATLVSGDGLLVRYQNPRPARAFLMVFALDAAGETHWLHPAYLDAAQDPESVAIEARVEGRALDELVEPEAPAPGRLRVFAVFSERPLRVREVEARLRQVRGTEIAAQFPGANVQEWSAQWTK